MLARLLFSEDEKAYEAIYLRYWRTLYATAAWKTGDTRVAEELVQELFMQLWENRQKKLIGNLEAYLKTAIRYKIISFIKNRLADPRVDLVNMPEQQAGQQADSEMRTRELSKALEEALSQLPDKTRIIFQMSRFEQNSNSEIAKQMGITERAVEYHITQSLRQLRLHLKDYLPYAIIFLWK